MLEKNGVRNLISEVIDEILRVAGAQGCNFGTDFKQNVMEEMIRPTESNSIMYQDYAARRPMEVETYLGSPIKMAQSVGVRVPRIETMYALLHHTNVINQQRPKETPIASPPGSQSQTPRLSSAPPPGRPVMNGMNGNGMGRGRARTSSMGGPQPGMPGPRRGGPMMNGPNGYGRPVNNGYGPPPRTAGQQSRRGSIDNDLGEEFAHLALYDDIPEGGEVPYSDSTEISLRERELMLKQKELALREQEMRMRRAGPAPRKAGKAASVRNGGFDDDDDDDDYFDPANLPPTPMIDPDNFDMMSVTSKRYKRVPPSNNQIRRNPEFDQMPPRSRGIGFPRPGFGRNRSSANIIASLPGDHDSIMNDPLMQYADNRYGNVDRVQLGGTLESRTNSLTAERLQSLQGTPNGGPYPRRTSQSPGNPYSPQIGQGNGRPSPPNGYRGPPGPGGPSPPGGIRQPLPRYPPGHGNIVAPQQVEQHAGVSALHPPKAPEQVRSLTGSASASAGSGESIIVDAENSAHSSQSSLGPRQLNAVQ